jgi:hypothetical protein
VSAQFLECIPKHTDSWWGCRLRGFVNGIQVPERDELKRILESKKKETLPSLALVVILMSLSK